MPGVLDLDPHLRSPLSATRTLDPSAVGSVYLIALSSRLARICSTARRSAQATPRDPGASSEREPPRLELRPRGRAAATAATRADVDLAERERLLAPLDARELEQVVDRARCSRSAWRRMISR